jgi:hypothetical protein
MPPVDPGALIAGFRGRFFWETGEQMGECKSWEVIQNTTTTDEGMLDSAITVPVFQSASFTLNFSVLTVSDRIPMRMLTALRARAQLWLRFVGEIETPEGVARYVVDRVTPDGNQRLFYAEQGQTITRDHAWKVAAIPDVPAPLRTNAAGTV